MINRAVPIDRRITVTYPDVSSTLYSVACDFAITEVQVDPEDREIWFDIFESQLSRTKACFAARFGLAPLSVRVAATVTESQIDIECMDALVEARSALAAAWKEKLGLHYVPPRWTASSTRPRATKATFRSPR